MCSAKSEINEGQVLTDLQANKSYKVALKFEMPDPSGDILVVCSKFVHLIIYFLIWIPKKKLI